MLDIYICEDNERQLKLFEKYIQDTIMIEELDMQIVVATDDPCIVIEQAKCSNNLGLYFLDIDLKTSMNGLQLAQEIRKLEPRCFIIFITSHSEMSFLTFQYKVEALDFIIKDNAKKIREKIHECITNVNEKYSSLNNNTNKVFTISLGDRKIHIEFDNIIFFETSSNIHKVILHGKNRTIEFTAQLKEVQSQLDSRFYRCHRSYIVNKDNIKEIDFNSCTIHMINGETCLLSVRMKKGLKK